MSVLFILIAVSLVFASGFLLAFIWAMNDRQFEDDHTPAVRMLFDALPSKGKAEIRNQKSEKVGEGNLFCEKVKVTSPDPSPERIGISNLSGGEIRGAALSEQRKAKSERLCYPSSLAPRPSSL